MDIRISSLTTKNTLIRLVLSGAVQNVTFQMNAPAPAVIHRNLFYTKTTVPMAGFSVKLSTLLIYHHTLRRSIILHFSSKMVFIIRLLYVFFSTIDIIKKNGMIEAVKADPIIPSI